MKPKIGVASIILILTLLQVSCIPLHQPSVNDLINAAITAVPDILPITEAEEIRIGRSIAANVAGRYGVFRDMELTRYVSLVGNTVARKSDRPNLHYSFAVLDTDIINAFSCPGGYVFITMGALEIIDNEAELAAVLAHEVGHVSKRHIIKEIEKKKFLNVGGKVVGNYLNTDPEIFNRATSHGTELLFRGYSRIDEYQADRLSLIYTSKAGYDPNALLSFLEKIKDKGASPNDENARIRTVKLLFSTHPEAENRIERAKNIISRRETDSAKGVLLKERYSENVTPIVTEYFRYYIDYHGDDR
ncbi:MAG: M48 family metalloprotease [Deltaproteobacteria bacterium]|uniref:M48 family metalloprotease n=1 Tax=Candidatus Zymogenus saltonus TaxID=2844893 RepID=A0A9D8PPZ3_9DELT|nr:M48 family metalloprotease [Candidatus Zymogenus saltonus]